MTLKEVISQYNTICAADEILLDKTFLYNPGKVPKTILKQRQRYSKQLVELDAERNRILGSSEYLSEHNFYRRFYQQFESQELRQAS